MLMVNMENSTGVSSLMFNITMVTSPWQHRRHRDVNRTSLATY